MTEKALTDIAADQFACDDGFMIQDVPSAAGVTPRILVAVQLGSLRPFDFSNELAEDGAKPARATSVDEALAVRSTLARSRR